MSDKEFEEFKHIKNKISETMKRWEKEGRVILLLGLAEHIKKEFKSRLKNK